MVVWPKKERNNILRSMAEGLKVGWLLLSVWLLSACFPVLASDTELTLKNGEKWELSTQVLISQQNAQVYGVLLNQTFNEMVAELTSQGIEAQWEIQSANKEGNQPYLLSAKGIGYQRFNQAFGQNALGIDETVDKKQVVFYLSSLGKYDFEALQTRFTLKGGEIISTNGHQTARSTVEWVDHHGSMEAVLTPASGNSWIFIVVLLATAGVVIIWFSRRARGAGTPTLYTPSPPYRDYQAQVQARYCSQCGGLLPTQAAFCPYCGHQPNP